jgi:hypothetical protein
MWTTDYTSHTPASSAAVWEALRRLHTGESSSEAGDTFVIHGPFGVGTTISVTPVGQDTFESTIIELVEGARYADSTAFGPTTLTFRHTLIPDDFGTTVTHELVIDGPQAEEVGPELGPQISEDFPAAMDALFDDAMAIEAAS